MLCTWARDHGVIATGIDMSQLFTEQAKLRAVELGVADQVKFMHGDAAGYVSDEKVSVAACLGATWITGGVVGTIELLARGLRTGGIILIGEPYWRQLPPTEDVAQGCIANSISDFLMLPRLLASFGHLGYDVVEIVLADRLIAIHRGQEVRSGSEMLPDEVPLPFAAHAGQMDCALPLVYPITSDTAYLGGIAILMRTWSDLKCISSIRHPFCLTTRRKTSPKYCLCCT